jgi:mono/diheme cytochrome c family protein
MAETPADIKYSDKGSGNKTPVVFAVIVAIVAAGVSIWGVSSTGLMAGVPETANTLPAPPTVALPSDKGEKVRLLSLGAQVHQESCAGCHAVDTKLIGPSYLDVCKLYGESMDVKGTPSPGVTDQIDVVAISGISFATSHPKNNLWDGYQSGPDITLTADQRRAVAVWIFNLSNEKEGRDD